MKIRKICIVTLVAALAVFIGVQSLLYAAPKYILKFNHVLNSTEPYHEGFLKWAKNVEAKTNGDLKIEVYHSAQLGIEEDVIKQISLGANMGQNTDSARMGLFVPEMAVMNAPYFVDTVDEVKKLKDLNVVKGWINKLEKDSGIKVLSFFWIQGYRHFVTNKPIKTPADLTGLKIRTPGVPVWQESIRALGATPVALAFGEMYNAVKEKTIDGCELVYNNLPAGKFYEVLKYVTETKHILLINFEVTSAKFFNSLPAAYQKILIEECDKAGLETTNLLMGTMETNAKKTLKDNGMILVDNVDLAPFKKAGEKAYDALKLKDARNKVYAELKKK